MMPPIVLASASPRRADLLTQLGLEFDVVAPEIDESALAGEDASAYVRRLALEKAAAVPAGAEAMVIAADTTVDLGGEILGKPADDRHARQMLEALSGRTHRVHTGVAVRLGDRTVSDVCTTLVTFVPLSGSAIDWYVATGEPIGKAGAYAVQGAGGVFVQRIRGSVSNVVGLPLHALARLAAELGVPITG
jgi:septum formation protein